MTYYEPIGTSKFIIVTSAINGGKALINTNMISYIYKDSEDDSTCVSMYDGHRLKVLEGIGYFESVLCGYLRDRLFKEKEAK